MPPIRPMVFMRTPGRASWPLLLEWGSMRRGLGRRPGWPFQFDHVAFGILHIDRGAIALGAVARLDRPCLMAVRMQVGQDRLAIERGDAQAEVIEVAAFRARRGTAKAAEFSTHRHQVDQRCTGAQLIQADIALYLLQRAAQHLDIEMQHRVAIRDAQHYMVDVLDLEHPLGNRFHQCGLAAYRIATAAVGRLAISGLLRVQPANHLDMTWASTSAMLDAGTRVAGLARRGCGQPGPAAWRARGMGDVQD